MILNGPILKNNIILQYERKYNYLNFKSHNYLFDFGTHEANLLAKPLDYGIQEPSP